MKVWYNENMSENLSQESPPLTKEEERRYWLLKGLEKMGKQQTAKGDFQKACDYCDPIARKACNFFFGLGSNSGGRFAIETSTYRQGEKANQRRTNIRRVIGDHSINTEGVPCEVMFDGKRAVKGYEPPEDSESYPDDWFTKWEREKEERWEENYRESQEATSQEETPTPEEETKSPREEEPTQPALF
jgi:hypothetical protein